MTDSTLLTANMTDRIYYRNTTTGERGWLVERDSKQYMQLNRPAEEILLPYRPAEWVPERDTRPLTRQQCAQVAFEADKMLCLFLGLHREAKRQWLSLTDEDRIAWCKHGPVGTASYARDLLRALIYDTVMGELKRWATE